MHSAALAALFAAVLLLLLAAMLRPYVTVLQLLLLAAMLQLLAANLRLNTGVTAIILGTANDGTAHTANIIGNYAAQGAVTATIIPVTAYISGNYTIVTALTARKE